MTEDNEIRTGRCLCGAIRFRATGEPLWVAHCHCESCRRATASAMATYAGFQQEQIEFTAHSPTEYHSSPGAVRGFCDRCGTPVSYQGERWPNEIHLFVCTFDEAASFKPQGHVYTRYQLPWLQLADELPRYATTTDEPRTD